MWGPAFGRSHDGGMYAESGLQQRVQELVVDGTQFYMYGDLAYALGAELQKPFPTRHRTAEQEEFNARMAVCRIAIEWGFNKITQLFPTLSWHRNEKVLEKPVAKIYLVAVLLCNFHTCLYGSPTAQYFGVQPPSLNEYLGYDD